MDETRKIAVTAYWRATFPLEVPAGAEIRSLDSLAPDQLEEIEPSTAELYDWDIRETP
jgi:hypothetical protein